MNPSTIWLCCGVLQAELEQLHRDGRIRGELRFLDSMLHMNPQQLQALLGAELTELCSKGSRVVLVYGDCCSRMLDLVRQFGISRVNAVNCAQMLAGRNRYRELMRDRAFMLLPEWAPRWKEILHDELGLHPEVARDLMRENRRELVYLDTAVAPAPREAVAECAAYTGLPWRIEKVSLNNLLALLLQAESGNIPPLPEKADAPSSIYHKPVTWADQVMMADVFSEILASSDPSRLAQILTEQMRELTGAHTAILIAQPEGVHSHRMMHVSPARRRSLLTADELSLFCPDLNVVVPLYVKDYPPEHPCRLPLLRAGVSSLMRFPLQAGEDLLATMLLLDLPGAERIAETEKIITHLTPVMALALKNALTHEKIERQAKELAYYANNLEQRVAERTEALQESEEQYRILFENAGEAIFVVQDRKLAFLNPTTTRITGYTEEELTSKPFVDFIDQDDRGMVLDRYLRRLRGEKISRRYTFRVIHQKGDTIWVELDTVLIHWKGKPATLNFMTDITERKRAEEALQAERQRLYDVLETLPAMICLLSKDYNIAFANRSFRDKFGEARGRKCYDLCFGQAEPCSFCEAYEALKTGKPHHWQVTTPDDSLLDVYDFPFVDADGTPMVLEMDVDITERKRAEEEIQRANTLLNSIVENIPNMIFLKDARELRFTRFNRAGEELLGHSRGDLLGKNDYDLFPTEQADFFTQKDRDVLRGKEIVDIREEPIQTRHKGERILHTKKVPILNANGEPEYLMGISEDITDRIRAQEKEKETHALLRIAGEKAKLGGWSVNLEESRVIWSDEVAAIHEMPAGTSPLLEEGISFYAPEWKERITAVFTDCAQKGIPYDEEMEIITAGGKRVWVKTIGEAVKDKAGRIVKVQGAFQDISERKQAEAEKQRLEERLRRAEKMEALGQLAGGVAHDLNNVLGILSGYSELLLEEIPEAHKARKHVEKILQSTDKGAAIIQDLLTLARRGVLATEVVQINEIISGFIKTPAFENIRDYHPGVTFRMECDPNLLNINGSPVHLETTLMNLVSNAAEAISGKGEVVIRTENRYLDSAIEGYDEVREGDYAVLTVSDTGAGIADEHREKIFEPFYTKKTMGRSGTGLGLTIVWGTVKDHNGYIDVQSCKDKGTTFTLYFPVTREERTARPPKIPVEQYRGRGEKVLVVDDIAEQREVASGLLEKLGYRVHSVSSGEEALKYLKDNRVDILVLDMIMAPGMDGMETYRRILEIHPKQKAILVSGFTETDRVRKAQILGAGTYVKKPYVMETIGLAIRKELER